MKRPGKGKVIAIAVIGVIVATFAVGIASGCSVKYVLHVGAGQMKVLASRQPVEKILADPQVSEEVKEKINVILEAKAYAEKSIGLNRTDSYTTVVKLDRPVASYNLMAAPPLELEPKTWWFPIVGKVPYLGYFDKKKALKKESKLKQKGYDTYLRGAAAYSTLGWFNDPIFEPILNYDIPTLVNITIHEMTHTTVFLEGHVDYNEGMALFVGNRGSLDFLSQKYGPDSEYVQKERDNIHNDRVFSAFLKKLHEKLDKLYDSEKSESEKLAERKKIFAEAKEDFEKLPLRRGAYRSFLRRELNNAAILSRSIYFVELELYRRLYEVLDRDLSRTVTFFRNLEINGVKDPTQHTRDFVEKHEKE